MYRISACNGVLGIFGRRWNIGFVALLFAWLFPSLPSAADTVFDKCMDTALSNADFNNCGESFLKRQDDRLNIIWKQLMSLPRGSVRKDLLDEQRAWLNFRDASCRLYANPDDFGREGLVIRFPNCRSAIIADRIKALEIYHGDMSRK